MKLPEAFHRRGTAFFSEYPEIGHEWSLNSDSCQLLIPASSVGGFDIGFVVERDKVIVYWGNWHSPYDLEEDVRRFVEGLFGLLTDMLSPDMRVRELYAGATAYRGFLESNDGTEWTMEQEMGLLFWNYFGERSVRTYSNSILPGRMSRNGAKR